MARRKQYAYEAVESFPDLDDAVPNFEDMSTTQAWFRRKAVWEAKNGLPKDAPYGTESDDIPREPRR